MKRSEIFNSPFELGVRMVYLLYALYPRKADLQRLMYLDYAVIYSGDLGGPNSLHTPVPLRDVEYASRREIIEEGLYLMVMRSFLDVVASDAGIMFGLGENGSALVELVNSNYATELAKRCAWVASEIGARTDTDLEELFGTHGVLWRAHYLGSEHVGGQE